ncbi:hypothetical protein B5X24_HaOG211459 [Helicoverpa armigera]|nr:hypothetical protein B5X24_HaOG211459 [Helicoverpa armigera]
MGSSNSKEEIVLAQNAAAGDNNAQIRQLAFHASATNIILTVLLVLVGLAFLYAVFRIYKNCHKKWILNEISRDSIRRSLRWHGRRQRDVRKDPTDDFV